MFFSSLTFSFSLFCCTKNQQPHQHHHQHQHQHHTTVAVWLIRIPVYLNIFLLNVYCKSFKYRFVTLVIGRSFSHFSFSQPIFLENGFLLLVSCHNGRSFFAYGRFFFLLSFDIYFMTFCLHQTLFSCSALYMFDSFALKFSFLSVFFVQLLSSSSLPLVLAFILAFLSTASKEPIVCVQKNPFRCLTFDIFFCVSDLHVQLPCHCIVWHRNFSFIIPYKALAILMCVYFFVYASLK